MNPRVDPRLFIVGAIVIFFVIIRAGWTIAAAVQLSFGNCGLLVKAAGFLCVGTP